MSTPQPQTSHRIGPWPRRKWHSHQHRDRLRSSTLSGTSPLITKRAARHGDGPSTEKLLEKRRRLIRGYTDGGFTLSEYETRLAQLDRAIHLAKQQPSVEMEEVAALLGNLPGLWREAQPDERRRLVAPFFSGVYIDVVSRMIAGLLPREPFRALLECAVDRVDGTPIVILPPGETAAQSMALVETGEN